jgi:small conductance mechanosensitive channel
MDPAQVSNQMYFIRDLAISFGAKLIGAILLWFIGKWLINLAVNLLKTSLAKGNVDPTIIRYIISFILIVLQVVLIVAILGFFGVETTSFAALLAATGIAIGAAWGGLLANFAAGAFLVMFRPFKVGDFVSAGGITLKL